MPATKGEKGPKYGFKVFFDEVDVMQLKKGKRAIKRAKRVLEDSLVQEKAKRMLIEEKCRVFTLLVRVKWNLLNPTKGNN